MLGRGGGLALASALCLTGPRGASHRPRRAPYYPNPPDGGAEDEADRKDLIRLWPPTLRAYEWGALKVNYPDGDDAEEIHVLVLA